MAESQKTQIPLWPARVVKSTDMVFTDAATGQRGSSPAYRCLVWVRVVHLGRCAVPLVRRRAVVGVVDTGAPMSELHLPFLPNDHPLYGAPGSERFAYWIARLHVHHLGSLRPESRIVSHTGCVRIPKPPRTARREDTRPDFSTADKVLRELAPGWLRPQPGLFPYALAVIGMDVLSKPLAAGPRAQPGEPLRPQGESTAPEGGHSAEQSDFAEKLLHLRPASRDP